MENEKFQELVLQQLSMLTEGQQSIRQAVARIEREHGEKLSALFDSYKLLSEILSDPVCSHLTTIPENICILPFSSFKASIKVLHHLL
jgi:hypothetical protein